MRGLAKPNSKILCFRQNLLIRLSAPFPEGEKEVCGNDLI